MLHRHYLHSKQSTKDSSSLSLRPRHSRRQLVASNAYQEAETLPPPIPPPPPPPPPPPTAVFSRRDSLKLIAVGGVGAVVGYLLGMGQSPSGVEGLSAEDRREIDTLRLEAKFKRDYDGHVQVQAVDGRWYEIRLDAQLPGVILLRDQETNLIYSYTLSLQQLDLTDDFVVVSIFGDGGWERMIKRVQGRDDAGNLVDAVMDSETFRDLISIMA